MKSNSSILTAVGSVVKRCSKVVSDWEMGIIAGSWVWYNCRSVGGSIAGY